MTDHTNALTAQAESIPDLIREQVPLLAGAVRKAIPTSTVLGARHVILTGCGDSAIAGSAAELFFRQVTGLPVVSENAMTVARFTAPLYAKQYPFTPLLVALSNSGEVARVVEAAKNTRDAGGYVVAITGSPDSRLAASSSAVIQAKAPRYPSAPGTRSYLTMLLALLLLGIRIGEVRGRITMVEGSALRKELARTAEAAEAGLLAVAQVAPALCEQWRELTRFDVLGAGPDRASARFAAAKLFEATAVHAAEVDLEEFYHLNYFTGNPESVATVLISQELCPARSRALELAPVLATLGRPTVVFGTAIGEFPTVGIPAGRPAFGAVLTTAPLAYFAGVLMSVRGETAGRGHLGPWASSGGAVTTRASELMSLETLRGSNASESGA